MIKTSQKRTGHDGPGSNVVNRLLSHFQSVHLGTGPADSANYNNSALCVCVSFDYVPSICFSESASGRRCRSWFVGRRQKSVMNSNIYPTYLAGSRLRQDPAVDRTVLTKSLAFPVPAGHVHVHGVDEALHSYADEARDRMTSNTQPLWLLSNAKPALNVVLAREQMKKRGKKSNILYS